MLGRLYEQQGRWRRAQSQYIQAVITPETGLQAIAGLERLQEQMEGEPLSVDLVDRMIQGKVHNFSAATKFEPTPETDTNRCVLVELFTNPHFGASRGRSGKGSRSAARWRWRGSSVTSPANAPWCSSTTSIAPSRAR